MNNITLIAEIVYNPVMVLVLLIAGLIIWFVWNKTKPKHRERAIEYLSKLCITLWIANDKYKSSLGCVKLTVIGSTLLATEMVSQDGEVDLLFSLSVNLDTGTFRRTDGNYTESLPLNLLPSALQNMIGERSVVLEICEPADFEPAPTPTT